MTDQTPTPPPPGAPAGSAPSEAQGDGADFTAATKWLEREIEATSDKARKAQLLHELGELLESLAGDETRAVKSYVAAVNADPTFRPPLWNLHRIFTLRRSHKNLVRILDAEVRAAPAGPERARALSTRAELAEDFLDDLEGARKFYEDARREEPKDATPLLALERFAAADGDVARQAALVEALLTATTHPALAAALAAELARVSASLPDATADGLSKLWSRARGMPSAPWSSLVDAERFAAREDRPEELADVLVAQAERAEAVARGTPTMDADALRWSGAEAARRAAVALYRRAARIHEVFCKDPPAALPIVERGLALSADDLLLREDRLRLAEKLGDESRIRECVDLELATGTPGRKAAVLVEAALSAARRGEADAERELLVRAVEQSAGGTTAVALLEAHLLAERDAEGLAQHRAIALGHGADPAVRLRRLAAAVDAAIAAKDAKGAQALLAREPEPLSAEPTVLRARVVLEQQLAMWPALAQTLEALAAATIERAERLTVLRDLALVAAFRLGDRAAAMAACEKALEVDTSCRWALWMGTDLGAEAGAHDKRAQAHVRLADLADEPDDVVGHLTAAAHAWSLAGHHDTALICLQRALERVPGSPLLEAMVDERLRALGRIAELIGGARRRADQAADPAGEETQRLLGRAAVAADILLGDPTAAATFYQRLVDVAPEDPGAWLGLVRALESSGDAARVARALQDRAARTSDGDVAALQLELGERWEAAGRLDLAEAAYSQARTADPELVDAVPGMLATAGASAGRSGLARAFRDARSTGSPQLARVLDEELVLLEGPEGDAVERVAARDDAPPLPLLLRAFRAGVQGDVSGRLHALSLFQRATDGTPLAGPALAMLARAARVAFSDDLVQSSARAMVAGSAAERTLATSVADGLRPGLDDSLRAAALLARARRAPTARRTEVEVELAEALEQVGRDTEALASYQSLLETFPDDLTGLEGVRRTTRRMQRWSDLAEVCQRQARLVRDPFAAAPMWEEAGLVLEDHLNDKKRAEACFRSALDGDMGRAAAYERLHAILSARGAKRELAQFVARRAEVVMEPEVLTALFWEHAELLRTLGDREGALAALENLLLLDEQHVLGLGMRAALFIELKRIPEAVQALAELSDAETDVTAKRAARLRASELLEKTTKDLPGAIAELWKLDEAGFANLETFERIVDLAIRASDSESQLRSYARLAELRQDVPGRVAAERAIAELERKAGRLTATTSALRRLLAAAPDDLPAIEALCEIEVDPADRGAVLMAAETALRRRLEADCLDVAALHGLAQVQALSGQRDARFLTTSILTAMGVATAAEAHDAATMREVLPRRPGAALGAAAFEALVHPDDRGAARELWVALGESTGAHYGLEPSAFKLGKSDRIAAKGVSPLRDEVAVWTGALSLGAIELYQGGPEPGSVIPLPAETPILVLGSGLGAPLSAAGLFALGRAAVRLRRGTAAMHGREPDEIGALLYAAVRMVDPGSAAPPLLRLAEFTASLPSSVPRKLKKGLPEPARRFAAGPDFREWVLAERSTANRAGALFARDPAVALSVVTGGPTEETALRRSPEAQDLVRFLISPAYFALRRETGLAIS